MDLVSLEELLSPQGQRALARAMELAPDESTFLLCHNRLSREFSHGLARAACETALLRGRAAAKFSRAAQMYFTREALEQATSEVVARWRARRFAGFASAADLCCGIGGDALTLAEHTAVLAIDREPLRVEMARLNLAAYGVADRAEFAAADVLDHPLPGVEAVFADPDRRAGGRRAVSLRGVQPPLDALRARLPAGLPLGVKLAPASPWGELDAYSGEVEFVSLDGELKECVLWQGTLAGPRRRASVLPAGDTMAADRPALPAASADPGAWLYDPDPAVVRAGLVSDLGRTLDAWPLDPAIAYLSADRLVPTPFARVLAVESSMPFHLRRLQEHLRHLGVGRVEVRRRGSVIEPDELRRRLKLKGDEFRVLVLTQVRGEPAVLVARPAGDAGTGTSATMSG